nr:zinc finger, CCHC-type [Tanacetum cinerariifolium]
MLRELKTLFAQQAKQGLLQTTRDFHSCKQEEGQSVSSYVLKMKGYINNLEHLGHPVTLGLGVSLILIGLRKEYDGVVQNYNMHSMGKTVNELHAMLKLHEQTLPKNNAPALHAILAGKVQKVNKHKKSQTQMAARGQNHRKGKNKQAYAPKPKIPPLPKREYPAKDSICHECDGFVNHFVNNTIQVSRNNMVYFSAIPRDGIFKIDLSNSHTNESFIYAASNKRAKLDLDSALLWLCRRNMIDFLIHLTLGLLKNVSLEVENQLGKTIKFLRSDHGGEYMSQEFLDHLKDNGIIAHRTPPYTPQHNGYPKETMGYSFYHPPDNKVLVARNAEFLENSLINQEASGFLKDLEIIQEEDKHPSIDTSLNHKEDNLEIDEPQSDIVPIRRSTRTRHAPDRMCLYIDTEEHKLGDLGEPANCKAALLDPESVKWFNAMNVEMQSMKDNEVWVLDELPPNGKTIGSKWLFKKKTDMDGIVRTYKARLVAKGYTQTPGIDYEETFSPVADIRAIRILIAIDAYYDYEI